VKTRRKKIKLLPHDRKILVDRYLDRGFSVGQLGARPGELAALANEFNAITGLTHSEGELLHYMRTERKNGDWVKLGEKCPKPPALPEFSSDECESLVLIFEENVAILGTCSDGIGYEPEIAQLLEKSFLSTPGALCRGTS
jgi:hypothetical protein